MDGSIVFIHTVAPLIQVFNQLGEELLPGVRRLHILDEPLLARVIGRGALAPEDSQRIAAHVESARVIGAHAVLLTCSTLSPIVDQLPGKSLTPVFKIDEAMIRQAVSQARRIAVIATNASTLQPTQRLLEAEALRVGRPIVLTLHLVQGALPALLAGDGGSHDQLVKAAVLEAAPDCDVVLLAQASMARALRTIVPSECATPVLSSPHLALGEIGRRVFGSIN